MRKYVEFTGEYGDDRKFKTAAERLNEFTQKNDGVKVEGYQVVRSENFNHDQAYILASYEVIE